MNRAMIICTTLLLTCMVSSLLAQKLASDINFFRQQLTSPVKTKFQIKPDETNEIRIGVQYLFLFYKNFLSSQDNQNCSFSPSCSNYCLQAIRKRGVISGTMSAFDRLTRCNYLSPENYSIDYKSGRLLDPVE